jgi:hypothetical protein
MIDHALKVLLVCMHKEAQKNMSVLRMDEACSFCILPQERGNCKQTESPAHPMDTVETQKKRYSSGLSHKTLGFILEISKRKPY